MNLIPLLQEMMFGPLFRVSGPCRSNGFTTTWARQESGPRFSGSDIAAAVGCGLARRAHVAIEITDAGISLITSKEAA